MTVTVNGRAENFESDPSVADVVRRLGRDPARPGIAVARNGEVVPRGSWDITRIADGDNLEVLVAVGGG